MIISDKQLSSYGLIFNSVVQLDPNKNSSTFFREVQILTIVLHLVCLFILSKKKSCLFIYIINRFWLFQKNNISHNLFSFTKNSNITTLFIFTKA